MSLNFCHRIDLNDGNRFLRSLRLLGDVYVVSGFKPTGLNSLHSYSHSLVLLYISSISS